ncbi:DMT family transporter [Rhodococcoides fascians]|uniref:DMT family transporter n=1 Tax=Rhodococcoides fascians TaxID=1828 RepID=UPI00050C32A9|nr:DMT family transporter [Rhodococcus fascians]
MADKARSTASGSDQRAYLNLLVAMALFGTGFVSSKQVVGEIPHQVAAVLRFGGGALILLLIVLAMSRRGFTLSRGAAIRAGAVGLLGVFAYNVFFFWGLSLAPALDGTVIVPVMSPVITTTFMVITGREQASGMRITGLILAVCGAILFFVCVGGANAGLSDSRLGGDAVFLAAAACWAAYTITSKNVLKGTDPLQATAVGTAVGALALAVLAAPAIPDVEWSAVSSTSWLNIAYLAIGPTVLAYLFYFRGLRHVRPTTATILMFATPIFGSVCAVVFLGETFTGPQLCAAIVTVAGALLAVTDRRLPSIRRRR